MVNNYNLEYELLKKSRITDRSPKATSQKATHIYNYDNCECDTCLQK